MKNKKAIFLLFSANTVSGMAQGISMIAIPWHFTTILDKASLFGTIYAVITGISLIWGLYVGTIVDKYNRKNIFLTISIVGGCILLGTSLFGFVMGEVHYVLAALAFCTTYFIYSVHYPNLYAFAQEITEPKHYGKITSYIEIQGQLTSMIAGAGAAMLLSGINLESFDIGGFQMNFSLSINKWHLHEVFLLDATTYLLALVLICFIKYTPVAKREAESGSIKTRLITGIKFLQNNPLLFLFGTTSFSVFVTVLVIGFYLAPIYINNHLGAGASVYAISDVFFALGAVAAGVGVRWLFKKATDVEAVILLTLLASAVYFFYVKNQDVTLFYLTMLALGMCNAGIRIMRVTYLFNHIPNQIIGRVNGVFGMINVLFRLIFISSFSLPFFISENNVVYAFLIMAVFVFIASIPMIYKLRTLNAS